MSYRHVAWCVSVGVSAGNSSCGGASGHIKTATGQDENVTLKKEVKIHFYRTGDSQNIRVRLCTVEVLNEAWQIVLLLLYLQVELLILSG